MPASHGRSTATKRGAWLGFMSTRGERAGRKVAYIRHWLGVCGVVQRCRARLEQEDAQICIGSGKTTSSDARRGPACHSRASKGSAEERQVRGRLTTCEYDVVFVVDDSGSRHWEPPIISPERLYMVRFIPMLEFIRSSNPT